MIRRTLESGYSKVSGALKRIFVRGIRSSPVNRARWIEVFYLFGIILFAAGIINATVQPVNQNYIILPGSTGQTISETVINSLTMLLGASGIYVSYLSGRQTTRPRMVNFYLALGLILIVTAMYIGIYVYASKI